MTSTSGIELMKFIVGSDFDEFSRYLRRIGLYKGEDLKKLETMVVKGFLNFIVWKSDGAIIGHAIWHESNTQEHRKGDPREKEDSLTLERLFGGKKDFVELHEVWLTKEHRGKGYGKKFFEFFEEFIRNRGYDAIVYYAFHPAAIAICRQRGYKEAYGLEEIDPEGQMQTCYTFCLSLKRT